MKDPLKPQRLESLDVLRGFDLFCLVALSDVLLKLAPALQNDGYTRMLWWFTHVDWEGFSSWDLVMPLFLFMSGISIPFALGKARAADNRRPAYRRIARRFILLWLFGMICPGNLLGLDPHRIYLFSNTLQSIAVGYVGAALLFLNTRPRTQVVVCLGLLAAYWAAMQFVRIDGFGGGNYTPEGNLAEWIDCRVLGRFRDGATVVDGQVVFAPWYHYTWILSSLGFIATVVSGTLAGIILRGTSSPLRKTTTLLATGAACVAAGWLFSLEMPVIKKLWTSSMVLVSSGYCYLLMGVFYYIVDCKHITRPLRWLRVYGTNSILAYMLAEVVSFSSITQSLLFGFEQYVGPFYPALIAAANAALLYAILYYCDRRGIYLKV
jgi:predicted acyltransferase